MTHQLIRSRNRKLKKRLQGLESKLCKYHELGAEIALVIRFPNKDSGYTFTSSDDMLSSADQIVG